MLKHRIFQVSRLPRETNDAQGLKSALWEPSGFSEHLREQKLVGFLLVMPVLIHSSSGSFNFILVSCLSLGASILYNVH